MWTLPRYGCSRRHAERSWLRDNSGESGGTGCWEMEKKNRTVLRWEAGRNLGKINRDLSPGGLTSLKNLTETLVPTRNKVVSVHDIGWWLWVVTQAAGPGFYIQVSGLYLLLSVLNTIDSNKIQIVRLQGSSQARGVQNTNNKKKYWNAVISIHLSWRPFIGTLNITSV